MTGFLCALGGVCLQAKSKSHGNVLSQQGQPPNLYGVHSTNIGSGSGYSSMSSLNTISSMGEANFSTRRCASVNASRGHSSEYDGSNVIQ